MIQARWPLSVVVVDDNQEFLDTIQAWMTTRHELEVLGSASDGETGLRQVDSLQPDLVLMDATMPVMDGFEATRRIRSGGSNRWVVIVSFHDSDTFRKEAWAAGADAFVSKADIVRSLPGILRDLQEGGGKHGDGLRPGTRPTGGIRPAARPTAPETEPGDPVERTAGLGERLAGALRRMLPSDWFENPAGKKEPAMAISGNFGDARGRGPKIHNSED